MSSRRSTWRGSARYEQMSPEERQREIERVREANRIHCKETRDRKREKERILREEVEVLTLYKSIVEDGPDLFSLHNATPEAPFSFLCDNFYQRLQLNPDEILGRPLSSIVDPRDSYALRSAIYQVLDEGGRFSSDEKGEGASSGLLLHLRVVYRGMTCEASMTIVRGSHGIIVVTRLYNA